MKKFKLITRYNTWMGEVNRSGVWTVSNECHVDKRMCLSFTTSEDTFFATVMSTIEALEIALN